MSFPYTWITWRNGEIIKHFCATFLAAKDCAAIALVPFAFKHATRIYLDSGAFFH